MLISKTLPNLMNGVSQQPDALRYDTQCASQENAYPSVVEGLSKRLPTEHIAKTAITTDAKTFVHTINREAPEQYTVILRDQMIKVYDLAGNLKTVEIPTGVGSNADSVTYLDTDNADTALKALTIADVTYITNSEQATRMIGNTPSSVNGFEALVFIKQAYNSTYGVTIKQGDTNIVAEFAAGASPSSEAIATDLAADLNKTAGTQSWNTGTFTAVDTGSSVLNAQAFEVQTTDAINQFRWKSLTDLSGKQFRWTLYSGTTGGPTTAVNTGVIVTGPAAYEVQTVTLDAFTPVANTIYWVVQEQVETTYSNGIPTTTPVAITPGWAHSSAGGYPSSGGTFLATAYWGASAQSGDFYFEILQQDSATTTPVSAVAVGPVVYISSNEDFTVTATNTYADTYIEAFKDKAQKFNTLPLNAKDGMIIRIAGEPDSGIDDYYVKFVTSGEPGGVGKGTWEECAGPDIENGLEPDPTSMPHLLIKQPNGTFVFKPADGENHTSTSTGSSATYDYSKFKWGQRKAGDQLTNPDPTFIGKTINNMFLFKNRLGILADENIIFSEAGEYFNFFRITVIDLLDTAVIDIASASSEVALLKHAIPLSEKLVVLSNSSQFVVQADSALSAKTVSIARSTTYNIIPDAPPTAAENSIFFAFNRGSFSGVREYFPTGLEETFEGVDISTQVPKYIPADITKLVAASHENVLFAITSGDTDALYVYNYYNSDQKRVQSAWHRWDFGTGTKILNIDLVDTFLYLTMYRAEGVFIEKMAVELGKSDTGSTYVSRLDRRVTQAECTVSTTTITLPYKKTAGRNIEIITTAGERINVTTQADGSNQITAEKDMTGVNFYAGEAYEMSYTFSDVVLREPTQTGGLAVMTDGRLQVRYGTVTYGDSGYFNVQVTPDFRDTSDHEFTGRILGAGTLTLGSVPLESGEFRFPVFSKAEQVGITIKNDTPLPCNILSAEYEISWNPRARRM